MNKMNITLLMIVLSLVLSGCIDQDSSLYLSSSGSTGSCGDDVCQSAPCVIGNSSTACLEFTDQLTCDSVGCSWVNETTCSGAPDCMSYNDTLCSGIAGCELKTFCEGPSLLSCVSYGDEEVCMNSGCLWELSMDVCTGSSSYSNCSEFSDKNYCGLAGCEWLDETPMTCSGVALTCSDYNDNESNCIAFKECSWDNETCTGSELSCSNYDSDFELCNLSGCDIIEGVSSVCSGEINFNCSEVIGSECESMGCLTELVEGSCSGEINCGFAVDNTSCEGLGCSWANNCNGMVNCSVLDSSLCSDYGCDIIEGDSCTGMLNHPSTFNTSSELCVKAGYVWGSGALENESNCPEDCYEGTLLEEICGDSLDNDGDGDIDCKDSDCQDKSCEEGGTCKDGICEITQQMIYCEGDPIGSCSMYDGQEEFCHLYYFSDGMNKQCEYDSKENKCNPNTECIIGTVSECGNGDVEDDEQCEPDVLECEEGFDCEDCQCIEKQTPGCTGNPVGDCTLYDGDAESCGNAYSSNGVNKQCDYNIEFNICKPSETECNVEGQLIDCTGTLIDNCNGVEIIKCSEFYVEGWQCGEFEGVCSAINQCQIIQQEFICGNNICEEGEDKDCPIDCGALEIIDYAAVESCMKSIDHDQFMFDIENCTSDECIIELKQQYEMLIESCTLNETISVCGDNVCNGFETPDSCSDCSKNDVKELLITKYVEGDVKFDETNNFIENVEVYEMPLDNAIITGGEFDPITITTKDSSIACKPNTDCSVIVAITNTLDVSTQIKFWLRFSDEWDAEVLDVSASMETYDGIIEINDDDKVKANGEIKEEFFANDIDSNHFGPGVTKLYEVTFIVGNVWNMKYDIIAENSFGQVLVQDPIITSFPYYVSAGETATLNQSWSVDGTAIIFNGTGATLDCDGNTITGNGTGNGIEIISYGSNNVNNCRVTGFETGIEIQDDSNHVEGNYLYDNYIGINLNLADSNVLINNEAYENVDGIVMNSGLSNELLVNTVYNNTAGGILLDTNSNNNNITGNIINDNGGVGIDLRDGINNNLINNNIYGNYRGIYLDGSSNNNLINNTANSNTKSGFELYSNSNGNNLSDNTASYNEMGGILFSFSSNNILLNDVFTQNNEHGINLYSNSIGNNFTNIRSCDNNQSGGAFYDFNDLNGTDNIYSSSTYDTSNPDNTTYFDQVATCAGAPYSGCVNLSDSSTYQNKVHGDMLTGFTVNDSITLCTDTYQINVTALTVDASSISIDCNGSTLSGDRDSGDYGIYNSGKDYVNVTNCNVTDYNIGFNYFNGDNGYVTNNTVTSNTAYGISLRSSFNNIFTHNTADSNSNGFYLWSSSNNNSLTNNTATSNTNGIYLGSSSNNNLTSNTVISNTNYGIFLGSSSNNNILIDNTVTSNTAFGISLLSSSNNTLANNTASNNNIFGIYLRSSSNNTITSNAADSNTLYGIYLYSSSNNNNLANNTVSNNDQHGVYITSDSTDNSFTNTRACDNNQSGGAFYDFNDGTSLANTFSLSTYDTSNPDNTTYFDQVATCAGAPYSGCINLSDSSTYQNKVHGDMLTGFTVNDSITLCVDTYQINVTALTVDADNIAIDCNGAMLIGNDTSSTYSIYNNGFDYVNVTNCNITDYHYGIYYSNADNGHVINNTVNFNGVGIRLNSNNNNNTITGNTANYNAGAGIYLTYSSNNNIFNNTAIFNNNGGISLGSNSNNNTITDNTANSNSEHGIIINADSNTLINNTANSNTYNGISLSTDFNTLINNTANFNNWYGVRLSSGSNNNITSNTANSNTRGFNIRANQNIFINNTANSNSWYGFYLSDSSNNNITNNTFTNNTQYGIFLRGSTFNTLINNTAIDNNDVGFSLEDISNNNILIGNRGTSNGKGIYLQSSSYTNITNNTMNFNGVGIYFHGGSNNILTNNILSNNSGTGIYMGIGTGNNFTNTISCDNNQYGGAYYDFYEGTSLGNTFSSSTYDTSNPDNTTYFDQIATCAGAPYSGCVNLMNESTYQGKVVNESGHYYINEDVTLCTDTYVIDDDVFEGAIVINASSITLDCNSSIINGTDDDGYGIYNNGFDYVNVTNCNVVDYYFGIYYSNANGHVTNNTAISNGRGISLRLSSNNLLTNNTANFNNYRGISIESSSNNNNITNNTFNSNGRGIDLYLSSDNILTNNIATSNYYGFYLWGSSNNDITNNTATSNSYNGIIISSCSNNTIVNNTVQENGQFDLFVTATTDQHCSNIVQHNTGSGDRDILYYNSTVSLSDEIYSELILCNADNSMIDNVTIIGSDMIGNNGIVLSLTDNTNVTNSNSSNNHRGVYLISSLNNSLVNNIGNNNKYAGINLYLNSSYNHLTRNTVNDNEDYGFRISDDSNNNTVFNNTILRNVNGIQLEYDAKYNNLSSNFIFGGNGIYLWRSSNNRIVQNVINNSSVGIKFQSNAIDNIITSNILNNNFYGTNIYSSSGNNFISNIFDNSYMAISIFYSENITFNNTLIYDSSNYIEHEGTIFTGSNFTNLTIGYNQTIGLVNWPIITNVTSFDLTNTNFKLYPDYVSLNSSDTTVTKFNAIANITINTSDCSNSLFVKEGFPISASTIIGTGSECLTCTEISCLDTTAKYTIDSFSGYAMGSAGAPYSGCVNLSDSSTYQNKVHGAMLTGFTVNDSITLCADTYQINDAALTVDSDNIAIDCNGSTLDGDRGFGYGIYNDGFDYVNVTNCNITGYYYGIDYVNVGYGYTTNNIAISNNVGIFIVNNSNNILTNNTANSNIVSGIYLQSSSNNIFTNNTANSNPFGVNVQSSFNNTFTNNTVTSNAHGIILGGGSNFNTLISNTFTSNGRGVYLHSSSNNIFTNNTANFNTVAGIFFSSSFNNTLRGNTANFNNMGFDLDLNSNNNVLTNNTVNSNTRSGINFGGSSNDNILNGNNFSNNDQDGISIDSISIGNNFTNTRSCDNNQSGGAYYDFNDLNGTDNIYSSSTYDTSNPDNTTYFDQVATCSVAPYSGCVNLSDSSTYQNKVHGDMLTGFTVNDSITLCTDTYQINVTALTVDADNIAIDCNGATLSGDDASSTYGIYNSGEDYVNLTNCNVVDYGRGIYYSAINGGILTNNNLSSNVEGIRLANSVNVNFFNNIANLNTNYGVYFLSCSDNMIHNNVANSNTNHGVYLRSGSNNTLTNNIINLNSNRGINIGYNSNNNTFTNNTINSNTNYGIYLTTGDGNRFTNNVVNFNLDSGFYIASDFNMIINNTANFNTDNGYYFTSSLNNTLTNNTANSNDVGISFWTSSNFNMITNNTCDYNSNRGIVISSSLNNTLIGNNLISNGDGIYLTLSSNHNNLIHNIANFNTNHGFYFTTTSGSNILTNNIGNHNLNHGVYIGSNSNILTNNIFVNNSLDGVSVGVLSTGNNFTNTRSCNNNQSGGLYYDFNDTLSLSNIYSSSTYDTSSPDNTTYFDQSYTCIELNCTDTIDNDGDGDIDCCDSDCSCDAGYSCNAMSCVCELNTGGGDDDDDDELNNMTLSLDSSSILNTTGFIKFNVDDYRGFGLDDVDIIINYINFENVSETLYTIEIDDNYSFGVVGTGEYIIMASKTDYNSDILIVNIDSIEPEINETDSILFTIDIGDCVEGLYEINLSFVNAETGEGVPNISIMIMDTHLVLSTIYDGETDANGKLSFNNVNENMDYLVYYSGSHINDFSLDRCPGNETVSYCGDGICNADENCENCGLDCGSCPGDDSIDDFGSGNDDSSNDVLDSDDLNETITDGIQVKGSSYLGEYSKNLNKMVNDIYDGIVSEPLSFAITGATGLTMLMVLILFFFIIFKKQKKKDKTSKNKSKNKSKKKK